MLRREKLYSLSQIAYVENLIRKMKKIIKELSKVIDKMINIYSLHALDK